MAVIVILSGALLITGCPDDGKNPGAGNTDRVQGKVIILQAYGNAGSTDSPNGVSHSFVELYNISDKAIDLSGISLYFANGIRGDNVTQDEAWKSIALTGTIPAKGSFLILGKQHNDLTGTRYIITDGDGDINDDNLSLNRRSFKVAVIESTVELTEQNPFNKGKPVSGYIDMVGALNNPAANPRDNIFGFEKAPARCSASEAARRKDLKDYDDNSTDFIAARYASTGDGAFTDEILELRKPRNAKTGAWDPFKKPADPPDPANVDYTKLKLNEVSGVGDDSEKFYEFINTGAEDIPLYGCKIYYNARPENGTLPEGKGNLTWTGSTQTIKAGKLYSLIGRNTAGSFSTGLTAQRILIIILEDPVGNEIDRCVRAKDTGDYAFTDKSFSRIPDGTGVFYFTTPTPNESNGASTAGLREVPVNQ
jgi:hypothetical protein